MAKYGLTVEKLNAQIARVDYLRFGETGTFCYITLVNGYTVTGESFCIDPSIFNEEMGKKVAYENAFNQLWGILGYVEKERWFNETQRSVKERVACELADLDENRTKLAALLEKDQPAFISDKQWDLLHKQADAMTAYAMTLQERLTDLNKA